MAFRGSFGGPCQPAGRAADALQSHDQVPPRDSNAGVPGLVRIAPVFANSEQPVLAGSPLAIEAIQKSAMDQRARCRRTTERHSVGGISLFGH